MARGFLIPKKGEKFGMHRKRRVHDGIVGGVALGYWVSSSWLLLPAIIGLAMIQSGFTGFCPVYYTLDRLGVGDQGAGAPQAT